MTPKTGERAIAKIHRVRQYLVGSSYRSMGLTFEQIVARNQAERLLVKVQHEVVA